MRHPVYSKSLFRQPAPNPIVSNPNPAPVNVQATATPLLDIRGYRTVQRLAGNGNRFHRRLERRAPALPLAGGVGDGWIRKHRAGCSIHTSGLAFAFAENLVVAMRAVFRSTLSTCRLVDGLAHVQRLGKAAIPSRERYTVADGNERPGRHAQAPDFSGVVERHNPHHNGFMSAPCSNALCCALVANNIRFSSLLSVAS